jgi:hypothetical protein
MVAPVPAQTTKLRLPLLPLCLPAQADSALRALCVALFSFFQRSSTPTPLLPITSLQTQQFHTITHSFVQRRTNIPTILNSLRTLSIVTGVYPLRPLFTLLALSPEGSVEECCALRALCVALFPTNPRYTRASQFGGEGS